MTLRDARIGRRLVDLLYVVVAIAAAFLFFLVPGGSSPAANADDGMMSPPPPPPPGHGGGSGSGCSCVNGNCTGNCPQPPPPPPPPPAPVPPPPPPAGNFAPPPPPPPPPSHTGKTPKKSPPPPPASNFQPGETRNPTGSYSADPPAQGHSAQPLDDPSLVAVTSPDDTNGWAVGSGIILGGLALAAAATGLRKPAPAFAVTPAPAPPVNPACADAAWWYRKCLLHQMALADRAAVIAYSVANWNFSAPDQGWNAAQMGHHIKDKALIPNKAKQPNGTETTIFDDLARYSAEWEARKKMYEAQYLAAGCGGNIFEYNLGSDKRFKPNPTGTGSVPAYGKHWVGDHWEDWSAPGVRTERPEAGAWGPL